MARHYTHSQSLRVVGQMLQCRALEVFELKYSDGNFHVQCGGPVPPYLDLLEFNYSLAEIEAWDAEAKSYRQGSFHLVKFESLPEILRTIGRRIDDQNGQLLRICNAGVPFRHETILIEYRTLDKGWQDEELVLPAISDHAMRLYKNRSRTFGDSSSGGGGSA
jgi:hypothetical protein